MKRAYLVTPFLGVITRALNGLEPLTHPLLCFGMWGGIIIWTTTHLQYPAAPIEHKIIQNQYIKCTLNRSL